MRRFSTPAATPARDRILRGLLGACVLAASAVAHDASADSGSRTCATARGETGPALTALARTVDPQLDAPARAVAHVRTEGLLPHERDRDQSAAAKADWPLARDAAILWQASGDSRYLALAGRLLGAWASVYQPDFDPIDETDFDGAIIAFSLVKDSMPQQGRDAFGELLRRFAQGYDQRAEQDGATGRNNGRSNWQSHRVKLLTLAALALDDSGLAADARQLFDEQVDNNIDPDGETLDYRSRDAMRYVVYDLQPLVHAARAAAASGQSWPAGRLGSALDWLLPYAEGTQTHEEFARSDVPLDRQRAEAGEAEYAPHPWQPAESGPLYRLASGLDGRYSAVAEKNDAPPTAWIVACFPR